MPVEPALRCHNLERYLGEEEERVHALRGISLTLEAGTVHAVVGPSGCGKSTLLYILGLLDNPDRGEVIIEGEKVSNLPDEILSQKRNRLLGFIFQFHFLLEDFTAQENVMIPMRRLGGLSESTMREKAAELLVAVGLDDKRSRPSRHLSGGEQQRVALARALINKPAIVLADEPTGNLDSKNSEIVLAMLRHSNQELGQTVLMITHNPEAAAYGDRIIHMRDGQIVAPEKDPQWTGHST